jgi:hypothetical protein
MHDNYENAELPNFLNSFGDLDINDLQTTSRFTSKIEGLTGLPSAEKFWKLYVTTSPVWGLFWSPSSTKRV